MTQQSTDILNEYGIHYNEDIDLRQGLLDMFKPCVFYTNGIDVHVLDYGEYMRVNYCFQAGLFGSSDNISVRVYNALQLKNTLEYIYFIRTCRQ